MKGNLEKHNGECKCDICRLGIEAAFGIQEEAMEKYGWYVHFVMDDLDYPYGMNVHTHGLADSQKHPDLQICLPMSAKSCHEILINAIEDNVKKGIIFEHGKKYGNIIMPSPGSGKMSYLVLFLNAKENGRDVLRMVFPEKDGGFIGEMAREQMCGCEIPQEFNQQSNGNQSIHNQ